VAEAATAADLKRLAGEWRDRFGPLPEAAENLLTIAELKMAAAQAGFSAVEIRTNRLMLTRRGDFVLIGGKFPRLTRDEGRPKLIEAIELVKKL
jgi:transcription-repair coupling factor (superfamily II helicase)